MRHRHSGRQLNRNSSHRKAMFRNMSNSLFQHELIRTTLPKAKDLRSIVEKIITLGDIFSSSSSCFSMFFGDMINGFAKFESSELVSIIKPFNSIIAIILVELSSPSSVMKSLSLSEKKLTDNEIINIIVIIDKKKAIDLIKTLKKIDIFTDL